MSLRPFRFWREVRMEHFINARRLVIYAVLAPVLAIVGELAIWVLLALVARVKGVAWWLRYYLDDESVGIPIDDISGLIAIILGVSLGAVLLLLMPLAFLLLPQSLRKARVRRPHLARIAVYSAPLLAWAVWLQGAAAWAYFFAELRYVTLGPRPPLHISDVIAIALPWIPPVAAAVGACIWWAAAVRRYLLIPHAWAVAVLLTILCVLAVALPIVLFWLLTLQFQLGAL